MKISIITINFNNKHGLQRTMESVRMQDPRLFEWIIIDGGSSDGSVELIRQQADHLAYWCSEQDNGIYSAQNKGIAHATGDYCLFLNSGDSLASPQVLSHMIDLLTADIVYGDMFIVAPDGKKTLGRMHKNIGLYEMYIDTVWHPASFIRRSLFSNFGNYDEQYRIVADYEFFFRSIIVHKCSTRYVPFPVSVFELNGLSSLPENKTKEKEERNRVLNKYLSADQKKELEMMYQRNLQRDRHWFRRILKKLRS